MAVAIDCTSNKNLEIYANEQLYPILRKVTKMETEIKSLAKNRGCSYDLFETSIKDQNASWKPDERYFFIWEKFKKIDAQRAFLEERNQLLLKEYSRQKVATYSLQALFEKNTDSLKFESFWKDDHLTVFEGLRATYAPRSGCIIS